MYRGTAILNLFVILPAILLLSAAPALPEAIVADHGVVSLFESIPGSVIEQINTDFHIYYVHTSHGSQIISGLQIIEDENSLYDPPYFREWSDDLGHNGDTSWVPETRSYLDSYPECNMAMFSWCGGCSDNTEEGINIYLNKMVELESDYPDVIFVYMTGHLDGTGPEGNLYQRNNQIRDFCTANDKILFDFADIESWDPDGIYYPDESDYCNWCYDWCSSNPCPGCASCAHSHCFNCYLKGKAWWWMMAAILSPQDTDADGVLDGLDNCRFTYNPDQEDYDGDDIGDSCDVCTDSDDDGWGNPGFPANTCPDDNCPFVYNPGQEDSDNDGIGDACDDCCVGESVGNMDATAGVVDMGDLTVLIDHLFISLKPLVCIEEADVDLSGQPNPQPTDVDMGDLTVLIDHLFINLTPLPACP